MAIKRLISGLLLAAISFYCIFTSSILVTVLVLVLSLIALHEFYELARKKSFIPSKSTGMLAAIVLILIVYKNRLDLMSLFVSIFVLVTLAVFLFRKEFHVSPLLDAGLTVLGVLYIPWLFSYAILIRNLPQGEWLLAIAIFATAMYDTSAYYFGRLMGRHPLWFNVSPGKTIEGTLGGTIMSVASVIVIGHWLGKPIISLLILGLIIAIMAQLGDLCESLFKRDVGVKDAGQILAGHGGMLDRCDSLFFTCPAAYLFYFFATL